MKKVIYIICLILLSGCATIVTGRYQKILVTSSPPGIEIKTDDISIITPDSFNLLRNKDYILVAEHVGKIQQKELKHKLQNWFWGNLLLGGLISGAVDSSTGACYELVPKRVHFDFYPEK